jgi:hypothetical protein
MTPGPPCPLPLGMVLGHSRPTCHLVYGKCSAPLCWLTVDLGVCRSLIPQSQTLEKSWRKEVLRTLLLAGTSLLSQHLGDRDRRIESSRQVWRHGETLSQKSKTGRCSGSCL